MSICETCHHDFGRATMQREREQERIRQYRRALMIACGRSHERMREVMLQAEAEMGNEPANEATE